MARFNFEGVEASSSRKRCAPSPIPEQGSPNDAVSEHEQPDDSSVKEEYDAALDQQPQLKRREAASSTGLGLSVTITDTDVLDCAICCEALAPPVYQCDNGHIACSSCCLKMENACPFCQMPIGYSRCRAIEKVLQSIVLSCKNAFYGCREALSYSKKTEHEKTCIYAPFLCPFPDCGCLRSLEQFKVHLSNEHATHVMRFLFDSISHICLKKTQEVIFLQEETEGNMFILSCNALNCGPTHAGNVVAVNSIGSMLPDKEFCYEVQVDDKKTRIKLISKTNRVLTLGNANNTTVVGNLFVPAEYFNSDGLLWVKLTIWQDGMGHMHV